MKNLASALSKCQAAMTGALKDSTNPAFKSRYADLSSVWDAIRRPLTDNGLSVTQQTDITEAGQMILVTTLWHTSGESIVARYPLNPVQATPQALGSCLSYARRYSLSSLLGVVQADDDGNDASQGSAPSAAKPAAPPPPPAKAKPADAAGAWAKSATDAIQQMRSADELDAWQQANFDRLEKLKAVQPGLYQAVMTVLQTTHETFSRREAAE